MFALFRRIFKFGIAGIFNTCLDWCIYFVLSKLFGQDELTAKIIGAIGGVCSAFILNSTWVFRDNFISDLLKHSTFRSKLYFIVFNITKMFAVYSLGMLINIVTFILCLKAGLPETFSLIFATGFSFFFNFFFTKRYVF